MFHADVLPGGAGRTVRKKCCNPIILLVLVFMAFAMIIVYRSFFTNASENPFSSPEDDPSIEED